MKVRGTNIEILNREPVDELSRKSDLTYMYKLNIVKIFKIKLKKPTTDLYANNTCRQVYMVTPNNIISTNLLQMSSVLVVLCL